MSVANARTEKRFIKRKKTKIVQQSKKLKEIEQIKEFNLSAL